MINIQLRHICVVYSLILTVFILAILFLNFNIDSRPAGGGLGNNKDYTITIYTTDSSDNTLEKKQPENIKKSPVKKLDNKTEATEIKKTSLKQNKDHKITNKQDNNKSKNPDAVKQSENKEKPKGAIKGPRNLKLVKGGSKEGLGGNSDYPPSYIDKILIYLQRYRYYPPQALKRHIIGTVKVLLLIECDGKLSGYKIISSSGKTILDDAVKTMLENTNNFPVNKGCGKPIIITVPIEFKMN